MIIDISYFDRKLKGSLSKVFGLIIDEINETIGDSYMDYHITVFPMIEIKRLDNDPVSNDVISNISKRLHS